MDTDKLIITIIVIATLGIFGFIALTSFKKPVVGNISSSDMIGSAPHYKGKSPQEAKLVLVEFSDFECPYCATIAPVVDGLSFQYPELSVVYRHFPLNIHRNAVNAAKASEAAAKQGKFWEYAGQLFDNQGQFSEENYIKYAENIGLNIDQFRADYSSEDANSKVQEDLSYANLLNLRGTPSFYVVYDGKVESVVMSSQNSLEEKIKSILGEPVQSDNTSNNQAIIELQVKAINLLATKYPEKNLTPSSITEIKPVEWPNAALGCPQDGMAYAEVIVPGYQISVQEGEKVVNYNTNQAFDEVVTCE